MAQNKAVTIKSQREEIHKSLIEQLEAAGHNNAHNRSLINDYMELWDDDRVLRRDIQRRGRKVTVKDSRGQPQKRNNESFDQLNKNADTKIKLLRALGIKNEQGESTAGGEDDAL